MRYRTSTGWQRALLTAATLTVATAGAASAQARPSFTIKECADASTLRSTIDRKRPDAAQKQSQVDRLMAVCRQKIAAERANPSPSPQVKKLRITPIQRPPNNPNPPPVRPERVRPAQQPAAPGPAQPPANGQTRTINVMDLMSGLLGKRREPAPAPAAPRPARPPRPAAPAAPAPAAAAAPAAPAPTAPAPTAPAVFTPPSPPSSTPEQRNVFGIQLATVLSLPACLPGVVITSNPHAFDGTAKAKQRAVAASCVQAGPTVQKLAQRMADAEGKPIPQGVDFALVRLASDRCPDWLSGSCTLSVALKSGIVLGVAFLTVEDAENDIVRHLSRKYGSSPSLREPTACDAPASAEAPARRRMGNDNTWKFADLSLSYWAVSGLSCGQGRVMVQTSALVDLFARAMSGNDQPQM